MFVLLGLVALALPPDAGANPEMLATFTSPWQSSSPAGDPPHCRRAGNLRFRHRKLGMAALGMGLVPGLHRLLRPTSIGLAVYGLIVYLNDPVSPPLTWAIRARRRARSRPRFHRGAEQDRETARRRDGETARWRDRILRIPPSPTLPVSPSPMPYSIAPLPEDSHVLRHHRLRPVSHPLAARRAGRRQL